MPWKLGLSWLILLNLLHLIRVLAEANLACFTHALHLRMTVLRYLVLQEDQGLDESLFVVFIVKHFYLLDNHWAEGFDVFKVKAAV